MMIQKMIRLVKIYTNKTQLAHSNFFPIFNIPKAFAIFTFSFTFSYSNINITDIFHLYALLLLAIYAQYT